MGRELYQLVAIDKHNKEYIIELNNQNQNNKGSLNLLDSGTTYFQSEKHLANYLFRKGKIPTVDVRFAIKYNYKGSRYLPVIYNDIDLNRISENADNEEIFKYDVLNLYRKIEEKLHDRDFYEYLIVVNDTNCDEAKNGNYLQERLMLAIIRYYETFIKIKESESEKEFFKNEIIRQMSSYKQFRTLYMYYQTYMNSRVKENNLFVEDKNNQPTFETLTKSESEKNSEIPEELLEIYRKYGMDGIYSILDVDDVISKGYKFK